MFEVYKSKKSGEYYFRLKAANGENILASEGYTRKTSCLNGVASVKKNAPDKSKYEKKESKGGKHYFNLKAANHQIIGTSQMYKSASGLSNGIKSVMKNAPKAKIEEV